MSPLRPGALVFAVSVIAVVGALASCSRADESTVGARSESETSSTSAVNGGGGEGSIVSDALTSIDGDRIMTDDADIIDIDAPLAVVAVQGPIDESASYVSISWSHVDLARHPEDRSPITGYDVARSGRIIGSAAVDDEAWDDLAFRDAGAPPGLQAYQVRARTARGPGPWSTAATVTVRTTDDVGPVFAVDDYQGTDQQRAEEAVADAVDAGGGVVLFGAATYSFEDTLVIDGDEVLLRGAGQDQTVLRPSFSGSMDSCGRATPLILFRGDPDELDVRVGKTVPRGSTTIPLDGRAPVEVGDFVEFDGVKGQIPTYDYPALGITQDPSTGNDERYPFDAGTVVEVGDDSLTIDHPTSPILTEGSRLFVYRQGRGNGIERLTVEGGGPDDRTHHRLIDAAYQVDFRLADVTARWANRNFLDASGHGITLVGFTGTEGGAAGYQPEPCKYKIGFGPATDVSVVDSVIGSVEHDRNMSLMTIQFVYRALIRNTVFGQSRTYGFNEHGGGSRDVVVENNWFGTGSTGWAGILLGNDTWGFGGETAIRSNRFEDNVVDVLMVENPYGAVIAGNRSTGCVEVCVTWSGWGAQEGEESAIADPGAYGSARLVVTGNHMVSAGGGLDLGIDESNGYPWLGIRDAVIAGNVVESGTGPAIRIRGDASTSGRLWVTDNRFEGEVAAGEAGVDWWWWNNTAGPATQQQPMPVWTGLHQTWELEESER